MNEENTEYKDIGIFDEMNEEPKRHYAKYENPTTVRVGAATRIFLREKEMPLSYLVRNAPKWYDKAQDAEDIRTNMNRYRDNVVKLQGEVIELLEWKKNATERLKKRNLSVEQ